MDQASRGKLRQFQIKHKKKLRPRHEVFMDIQSSGYGPGSLQRESSIDNSAERRQNRHSCCYQSLDNQAISRLLKHKNSLWATNMNQTSSLFEKSIDGSPEGEDSIEPPRDKAHLFSSHLDHQLDTRRSIEKSGHLIIPDYSRRSMAPQSQIMFQDQVHCQTRPSSKHKKHLPPHGMVLRNRFRLSPISRPQVPNTSRLNQTMNHNDFSYASTTQRPHQHEYLKRKDTSPTQGRASMEFNISKLPN